MFGAVREGDHVRARRDLTVPFMDTLTGTPTVRRGRRGIVREVRHGWWSTRCRVEFDAGWTTITVSDVSVADLRRTFGHGEDAWTRKRDISRGWRLGCLILNIPMFASVGWYLLRGGDPVQLVVTVADQVAVLAIGVALGHPAATLLVLAGAVVLHRLRRS